MNVRVVSRKGYGSFGSLFMDLTRKEEVITMRLNDGGNAIALYSFSAFINYAERYCGSSGIGVTFILFKARDFVEVEVGGSTTNY